MMIPIHNQTLPAATAMMMKMIVIHNQMGVVLPVAKTTMTRVHSNLSVAYVSDWKGGGGTVITGRGVARLNTDVPMPITTLITTRRSAI